MKLRVSVIDDRASTFFSDSMTFLGIDSITEKSSQKKSNR